MSSTPTQTVENEILANVSPATQIFEDQLVPSVTNLPAVDPQLVSRIDAMVSRLDEGEQKVLGMLFGLAGEGPCTPEQIASVIGLTSEQVSELHEGALVKLRTMEA